jgi:hypothetical protein
MERRRVAVETEVDVVARGVRDGVPVEEDVAERDGAVVRGSGERRRPGRTDRERISAKHTAHERGEQHTNELSHRFSS